jgi:hypothetical protein
VSEPPGPVSANNPCPFLRALVAGDFLADHVEPLSVIADTVVAASDLPRAPVYLIAMVANGLGPARVARNIREGARLDALRGGPLDKRGAGSRILDQSGEIDAAELARLDQFAADKTDAAGQIERGLGADELRAMMDANFARAKGRRRPIDRALMNGEWPVLLRVMGKPSPDGPYLGLIELRALFEERRLPSLISHRLEPRRFHRL